MKYEGELTVTQALLLNAANLAFQITREHGLASVQERIETYRSDLVADHGADGDEAVDNAKALVRLHSDLDLSRLVVENPDDAEVNPETSWLWAAAKAWDDAGTMEAVRTAVFAIGDHRQDLLEVFGWEAPPDEWPAELNAWSVIAAGLGGFYGIDPYENYQ